MTVYDVGATIQMIVLKFSLATVAFFTISAAANAADDIVFFQNDVMGSAIVAVNKYGDLCWSESYTPYGDKTLEEDVGIGMPAGCGLLGQERGYTGHTDDYESGLTYAQQRYYDPSIGRFLSVDPIGINVLNTRTINRYSYAANNPYRYTDPTGEAYGDPEAENDDWPSDLNWSDGDYDWAGYSSLRGGSSSLNDRFDEQTAEFDEWLSDYDGLHPAELAIGGGFFGLGLKGIVNSVKGLFGFGKSVTKGAKRGSYRPDGALPRDKHGNPVPDTNAPHTQLGTKRGRKGDYTQAREFDANGKPVRDIDFTDHGRPQKHPNPHQHRYVPNDTGGTSRRSKDAERLPF